MPDAVRARASNVRAVVLDVDGVLTDGTLVYGRHGEELKTFHVRDGLGIRMLRTAGIIVGVISARESAALEARLDDLHIEHTLLGRGDKRDALIELASKLHAQPSQIAYAGDDLLDLGALAIAGVSIAPADAHPHVRACVSWVTTLGGGRGAVREVADDLLEARGELARVIAELSQ